MSLDNIRQLLTELQKAEEQIEARHNAWKDPASKLVYDTLEKLRDDLKLPCTMFCDDTTEGLETVALVFVERPSRFIQRVDGGFQEHTQRGGILTYRTQIDGMVSVRMTYPYVEGIERPKGDSEIAVVDPRALDESAVFQHMEEFLQKLIEHRSAR